MKANIKGMFTINEIKKAIEHFKISEEEIRDGVTLEGFAEACYNDNSLEELCEPIDETSKRDWNLTDEEYEEAVRNASIELIRRSLDI